MLSNEDRDLILGIVPPGLTIILAITGLIYAFCERKCFFSFPNKPENLELLVTEYNTTSPSVYLTWSEPRKDGCGYTIQGYFIEKNVVGTVVWERVNENLIVDTKFTIKEDLTIGTEYSFKVSAKNRWGVGQLSDSKEITATAVVPEEPVVRLDDPVENIQIEDQSDSQDGSDNSTSTPRTTESPIPSTSRVDEPVSTEDNHGQPACQQQVRPNPEVSGDLSSAKLAGGDTSRKDSVYNRAYPMKAKPRGIAFILNNSVFTNGLKIRDKSGADMRNLKHVFNELHFDVIVKDNLSGREIKNMLEEIATNKVKKKHDCLILALLSHGVNGSIYGTDGELVKIAEITRRFDGERCPQLIGKPKIYFIQACRGEYLDRGGGIPPKQVKVEWLESVEHPWSPEDELNLVNNMLKMEIESTDAYASRQMLPSNSDTLLAYCTIPGFVSWGNSERGSWFIQAITEVFLEKSHREDLLSMMTMVNNCVANSFQSISGSFKQMPAPVSMLTKKLYFNPGYFES